MMRGIPKGDAWRGAEETAAAVAVRMVEGRLLVWVAYQRLCFMLWDSHGSSRGHRHGVD